MLSISIMIEHDSPGCKCDGAILTSAVHDADVDGIRNRMETMTITEMMLKADLIFPTTMMSGWSNDKYCGAGVEI